MQEQEVPVFDESHVGEAEVKTVYSQEETFTSFFKKGKKLAELDAAVKIPQTNKVQVPRRKTLRS